MQSLQTYRLWCIRTKFLVLSMLSMCLHWKVSAASHADGNSSVPSHNTSPPTPHTIISAIHNTEKQLRLNNVKTSSTSGSAYVGYGIHHTYHGPTTLQWRLEGPPHPGQPDHLACGIISKRCYTTRPFLSPLTTQTRAPNKPVCVCVCVCVCAVSYTHLDVYKRQV